MKKWYNANSAKLFAEVAELADARDLKSLDPKGRTGSIPVFGTNTDNVTSSRKRRGIFVLRVRDDFDDIR